MIHTREIPSPLGLLTAASDGRSLVGLWFEGQRHFGFSLEGPTEEAPEDPVLTATERWLSRYFRGEAPNPAEIPLSPSGTAFQRQVWEILGRIPYGKTLTYGQIAARLGGNAMAARAVGGAVGKNPISILIPCHRVLGAGGRLTGYAGGIEKKKALLTLEGISYRD